MKHMILAHVVLLSFQNFRQGRPFPTRLRMRRSCGYYTILRQPCHCPVDQFERPSEKLDDLPEWLPQPK